MERACTDCTVGLGTLRRIGENGVRDSSGSASVDECRKLGCCAESEDVMTNRDGKGVSPVKTGVVYMPKNVL
jgi:hypothetical protein